MQVLYPEIAFKNNLNTVFLLQVKNKLPAEIHEGTIGYLGDELLKRLNSLDATSDNNAYSFNINIVYTDLHKSQSSIYYFNFTIDNNSL